jgi:drug/metabolite transporter (DMT)-like permease
VQRFPRASFVGTIVVWASAFSVIKALIDHGIGAEQIALSRYLVAAPGFAFLLWRAGGLPGLDRRDATRLLVAGVVIVAGYHLSLNIGEESTASGVAALIVALSPALTMALAIASGSSASAVVWRSVSPLRSQEWWSSSASGQARSSRSRA